MIIRSYTADSVAGALKQVRQDMGGQAVVLKTRLSGDLGGGKAYEVTACLDQPTVEQSQRVLAAPSVAEPKSTEPAMIEATQTEAQPNTADDTTLRLEAIEAKLGLLLDARTFSRLGLDPDIEPLTNALDALLAADVPPTLAASLVTRLRESSMDVPLSESHIGQWLQDEIAAHIDPDFVLAAGDRLLVIGPAGAGKTSMVGRLAARLVGEQKETVKLMSLGCGKVAAIDEIESYGELLGVETTSTTSAIEASAEADHDKVVLIDSGAIPVTEEDQAAFVAQVETLATTHRLAVFPATMRSADVIAAAQAMLPLKPTHLAFALTDVTDRLGSILAAVETTGLKLALISDSPSGAGPSRTPDPADLVRRMLTLEVADE